MTEASHTSGVERAAILLLTLGEQTAASILKHMEVDEVQKIGTAMASVSNVPRTRVTDVLGDLLTAVDDKTSLGIGTSAYLRSVLNDAVGERKATSLLGRILHSRDSSGIEALKWMDPRVVADLVRNEHPQIIATILAHLSAPHAASVMERLPTALQAEIAVRLARLEEVPETALKELDTLVEQHAQESSALRATRIGGVRAAADIINLLPSDSESAVMEAIRQQDGELGDRIHDALFVFDNLLAVDDRGMQTILREVHSDTLVVALKGAGEAIRRKMFDNMSKRAGEILRDDLAAKGPVKLADVETAQKEILTIAHRLAEEGQIVLASGGEEFV